MGQKTQSKNGKKKTKRVCGGLRRLNVSQLVLAYFLQTVPLEAEPLYPTACSGSLLERLKGGGGHPSVTTPLLATKVSAFVDRPRFVHTF